jgi:hypothetical protein
MTDYQGLINMIIVINYRILLNVRIIINSFKISHFVGRISRDSANFVLLIIKMKFIQDFVKSEITKKKIYFI